MLLTVDLRNQMKLLSEISGEVKEKENIAVKVADSPLAVNLAPKQPPLNKEIIVQLQEVQHDYTVLQISSKKDDIDFSGTPSLEWLKGRDDSLYNEILGGLSRGQATMKEFAKIVEFTKNNDTIGLADWQFIKYAIPRFERGLALNRKQRAETDDLIIHQVLDYIAPKTQQRMETLKRFLISKPKAPEVGNIPSSLNISANIDIMPVPAEFSSEQVNELLDFLEQDLKWYQWYLEAKKAKCSNAYSSVKLFHLSYSRAILTT